MLSRTALMLLPIALIWSAIGGYLAQHRDMALAGAMQESRNLAKAFEENTRRTVEAIDTAIRAVRTARAYGPAPFDLGAWERASGLSRELTLQLALSDRTGTVTDTNLGQPVAPVSIADRDHFRLPRDTPGDTLFISRPVVGRVSQRWSVQFVRRVVDADGRFDGVIIASLDPDFLSRFYNSLEIGDATLLLLGRDGIVRAGASRSAVTPGQDLSGTALAAAAATAERGSIATDDAVDHVSRTYSWRRVDPYDLIVVVGMSKAGALAEYDRHLQACIAIGVALSAATLLVGILLTRNRRALLRSQAVLQATVQNISQGLLVVDQRRRIPVINARAAELLEIPPDLARPGVSFDALLDWQVRNGEFAGQDAEKVRALVRSGGIGETNSSYRRTRANGTVLEFHTKVLDTGLAVRTITDITEQERNARVLAHARDAAETAARARSEFLAVMSHEIRTPLNGVIGIAGLLDEMELGAGQREYVRLIRESGDHLLALINDILDYSRLDASRTELETVVFDPGRLVNGVAEMLRSQATAKGLRLTVSLGDTVPGAVIGDPGRLRQVLINLVGNAIKFTDRGWVGLGLTVDARADGSVRLLFSVTDSGIGIASDAIEPMFEAFSQADRSISRRFGGSGLGLAICRRLVGLMGGRIAVESELGAGSTFRFDVTLPLGEAQGEAHAEPAAAEQAGKSLRVLVAEDNATNRLVALRVLARLGHEAHAVGNGAEAIDALRQDAFDLVLMDVMMPEVDGLAATRMIRANEPRGRRLPIVGLTAHARPENLEACLAAGMDAVATKPVTVGSLRAVIAAWTGAAPAATPLVAEANPRFRELRESLGDEAAREIALTFAEDTGALLCAMGGAAAAGEAERVYQLAHAAAGAARNIGAVALARHAAALERDAGSLGPAGMASAVAAMQADLDAALAALGIPYLRNRGPRNAPAA